MPLPTKLSQWPDELPWPNRLYTDGTRTSRSEPTVNTCCISMWCVKALGGTDAEILDAAEAPCSALMQMGVPLQLAFDSTLMNDNEIPAKAWRYLIGELGYEEVVE